MHKQLHILGLLLAGPKTGYDLHRIVVAHGELFTDLKRGNVYYLLERMAQVGDLRVTAEAGARGPRRERLVYELTEQGRQRFHELLREVVRSFDVTHTGVEVGMVFLSHLAPGEAIALLEERGRAVSERRRQIEREMQAGDDSHGHLYQQLARDHLLSLIDAEGAWIDRALRRLREHGGEVAPSPSDAAPPCGDGKSGDISSGDISKGG